MTQQQSSTAQRGIRSLLGVAVALALICAFFLLNAKRIPTDGMTQYDEATHLHEGGEVHDILATGSLVDFTSYFLSKKVMKGVLYRVWYGAWFAVLPFGIDSGRTAGLIAMCSALLALCFLARRLAPEGAVPVTGALAVALACLAPILHVHGRTAMVEPINLAALLTALLLVVRDRQLGTRWSALLAALGLLLAFITKYNHALILMLAVGLDATIEAARTRRLRPFLPLCLALAPFLAFLASPERLKGFAYYVWTIPGGSNPIDPTGALYLKTLLFRSAPFFTGCVLLLSFAAFAVAKSKTPGVRLVALHLAVGLGLAQCNALKLERILAPLSGDLFALAAIGVMLAHASLRADSPLRNWGLYALLAVVYVGLPSREIYSITSNPMRGFERWIDDGLEFSEQNSRALWLGGSFDDQVIWNSATLRNRARETRQFGRATVFDFGGTEFFQKSKIDAESLRSGTLDPAALDAVLRPYRSLIVLLDPQPKEPRIADRFIHQLWVRIRESGHFAPARQPLEAIIERGPGRQERVRMEFWTRSAAR